MHLYHLTLQRATGIQVKMQQEENEFFFSS